MTRKSKLAIAFALAAAFAIGGGVGYAVGHTNAGAQGKCSQGRTTDTPKAHPPARSQLPARAQEDHSAAKDVFQSLSAYAAMQANTEDITACTKDGWEATLEVGEVEGDLQDGWSLDDVVGQAWGDTTKSMTSDEMAGPQTQTVFYAHLKDALQDTQAKNGEHLKLGIDGFFTTKGCEQSPARFVFSAPVRKP